MIPGCEILDPRFSAELRTPGPEIFRGVKNPAPEIFRTAKGPRARDSRRVENPGGTCKIGLQGWEPQVPRARCTMGAGACVGCVCCPYASHMPGASVLHIGKILVELAQRRQHEPHGRTRRTGLSKDKIVARKQLQPVFVGTIGRGKDFRAEFSSAFAASTRITSLGSRVGARVSSARLAQRARMHDMRESLSGTARPPLLFSTSVSECFDTHKPIPQTLPCMHAACSCASHFFLARVESKQTCLGRILGRRPPVGSECTLQHKKTCLCLMFVCWQAWMHTISLACTTVKSKQHFRLQATPLPLPLPRKEPMLLFV